MYPSISVSHAKNSDEITISLTREGDLVLDPQGSFVPVSAPMYPKEKEEGWWVVVGTNGGEIVDLKRVTLPKKSDSFVMHIPEELQENKFKMYLMSDSWIGCDQEEDI
jgi:pre-mRNA-splicing helicase BRR2